MEWLKKLSAAIDYIENNLDSDLSYEEAARISIFIGYFLMSLVFRCRNISGAGE